MGDGVKRRRARLHRLHCRFHDNGLALLWLSYVLGRATADYTPSGDMMANETPHCYVHGRHVELHSF
jgi:hypothetical protein